MEKFIVPLMSLYGDHHVIEVRRILLEIPGVNSVYASSAFQVIEISYDPAQVDSSTLMARLEEAGYLEDWNVDAETGSPSPRTDQTTFFRHSNVFQQAGQVLSFSQPVDRVKRGLWPCPGMDPIKSMDEGE